MLIAVSVLAVGVFAAIVVWRLRLDLEQDKTFRAQLNGGVRIDNHDALLS